MKLNYLFGNPRKKSKKSKAKSSHKKSHSVKANPKKKHHKKKSGHKKKNPQYATMKKGDSVKVVQQIPTASEINFMKQTIADASKAGQSKAVIAQLKKDLKNAMADVKSATSEIKKLKAEGYKMAGLTKEDAVKYDSAKTAKKVAKHRQKAASSLKKKRLEALKKARAAKKSKMKSKTKTKKSQGVKVMAKKRKSKKAHKKSVVKSYKKKASKRKGKKKYSKKKGSKVSVKVKRAKNKKSAVIRVRSNPMIGGAALNSKLKSHIAHDVAEVSGLLVGGAMYSAVNDLAAKYLPANVTAILAKAGPVSGAVLPLALGVLGHKFVKNDIVKSISKGLIGSAVVSIGVSLYNLTLKGMVTGESMSGVNYTPMGSSEYSKADFGRVEYTPMSGSEYSHADFGAVKYTPMGASEYSNADFGGDDDWSEAEDEGILI